MLSFDSAVRRATVTLVAVGAVMFAYDAGASRATDAPAPVHAPTTDTRHVCARAAFLADDYAHTHTGARAERRAVAACAAQVGGF